jgi:hypothetical protein
LTSTGAELKLRGLAARINLLVKDALVLSARNTCLSNPLSL